MRRIAALTTTASLLLGACGSGATTVSPEPQASQDETVIATPTVEDLAEAVEAVEEVEEEKREVAAESVEPALVASLFQATDVFAEPGGNLVTSLDATTDFGSQTTLLVLEQNGDWLKVALPIEPNGQSGWIPKSAASLYSINHRIEVDLEQRELTLFDGDEEVLTTPVAIGTQENPTPPGENLFVTDVLETGDPNSPYGPFALGLSQYSETLSEFGGGDGQIGIHGTNDPTSIGQEASHGCVRVPNDVVAQLAEILPLGTPVTIK